LYPTTKELFESFLDHGPQGKLELIEGRLIVGNTIVGSRLLLRQILQGWRADAAIVFAPVETWINALRIGFNLSCATEEQNSSDALDILEATVAEIEYHPEDLIAGEGVANYPYHPHHGVRQALLTSLHNVSEELGGRSFGRDFVMRLGENGFTPDLMFFKSKDLNQLHSWYLNGPAELVIEVLLPGHEYCDRIAKRDYYAAAGVPEYWIVAPQQRQVEFWRLIQGQYQQQLPNEDGRYRPSSVPGLAFQFDTLWDEEHWYQGRSQHKLFILEADPQPFQRIKAIESTKWGSLPFVPNLQLEPTPIRFEEYISWCPRAKFEFFDGKPQISYKRGTKRVLGLLLMTFGLASAVKVLPPQAWVQALKQRVAMEQQDERRKAEWWTLARQAATILREQFGIQRVGVMGDLVHSQPLNYWSEIKLVAWEMEERSDMDIYKALSAVSKEPEIRLLDAEKDYLTVDEKESIIQELVDI
jgi:Uma2 family endonuclease